MTPRGLPDLLRQTAESTPDALAVVDDDRSLTWGELEAYSNQLADVLRGVGVSPGDRVILRMKKSVHAIAAAYGIMKCGAAYVPLDVKEPAVRSQDAIRDAAASVAVAEPGRKRSWDALGETGVQTIINLGESAKVDLAGVEMVTSEMVAAAPSAGLDVNVTEDMLAYMLYTSGSTGKRKGVMLTHGNALGFVTWAADAAELTSADRLSSHAPMHFDLSVFDFYAAALVGATTYIVPATASMFPTSLAAFIAEHELTVWYSVPTVLRLLTERGGLEPGDLSHLRTIVFAGEVYPVDQLQELMNLFPSAVFWNWFGPTETNVCTAYRLPGLPAAGAPLPIGVPASFAEAFVVDEAGTEVEPGQQGELLISGPTVHAGYWGDPERTQRTMTSHPHDSARQAFRTGDLVRLADDGNFVFDGRNDHQIKTRGYRVELGEIEAFLSAQAHVREAVVVAVPNEHFTHLLHAFVIAPEEQRSALVKACRGSLAPYMVPASITCVPDLPRTLNHKVDRQLLTGQVSEPDLSKPPKVKE